MFFHSTLESYWDLFTQTALKDLTFMCDVASDPCDAYSMYDCLDIVFINIFLAADL